MLMVVSAVLSFAVRPMVPTGGATLPSVQRPQRWHPIIKMKPYVPDGMTPEQYEAIKMADREKVALLDYAAWGPRFKRVAAPFWATDGFLTKAGAYMQTRVTQETQVRRVQAALCRSCLVLHLLAARVPFL